MLSQKTGGCTRQKGFTLLELMIAVAIAAILAGIGTVSFLSWVSNTQSKEVSGSFRSSVTFARGQAVKHGGWVSVCGSEDGLSCSDSFENGWLVFHDRDRDTKLSAIDSVLQWHEQEYGRVEMDVSADSSASNPHLIFNYRGYPDRELKVRVERGKYNQSFMLHTTGRIEKL